MLLSTRIDVNATGTFLYCIAVLQREQERLNTNVSRYELYPCSSTDNKLWKLEVRGSRDAQVAGSTKARGGWCRLPQSER